MSCKYPKNLAVFVIGYTEVLKSGRVYINVCSRLKKEQLDSLKAQISGLTRFISEQRNWELVDVHIDISSPKKGSIRSEFKNMINECKAGLVDIVVVKNIGRLGRDTIEVLDAINTLREAGVRIIFKQEQLSSSNHFKKNIWHCSERKTETQ